ncbi:MAG TPA: metabolite traffic protein EboE, partial [Verrucomicrobiae bacterium]|nr:metabolite traffic protein EboE [Verrucomicrobiae bacterium]
MQLKHNIHLAYCTNIHRGQDWPETFQTLKQYTLPVRDRVSAGKPYAIGLRLSAQAALELSDPKTLTEFQRWLEMENCYVFTINGFPYGTFHGGRVKELAYVPDWTTNERVAYTNRLFDLLAELVPVGIEGSVSTVPGSFKPLIKTQEQVVEMRRNLWRTTEHIAEVSRRSGKMLHLGLEPEPLCYLETTAETVEFFQQMRADRPNDDRMAAHLGVNYDCCHLAVEYEKAESALERLSSNGIRISKLHFSSAMKVVPTEEAKIALRKFVDPVYFHQVIARNANGTLTRYLDLDEALQPAGATQAESEEEWRIHFHVPLHCGGATGFQTTEDHLRETMDALQKNPALCSHVEMETYTWEVLPEELKNRDVVEQLAGEYAWTLK